MSNVIREAWLMSAVEHLKPVFERAGHFLPQIRMFVELLSTEHDQDILANFRSNKCKFKV